MSRDRFYFKMFRTLKTWLCAKSGSISINTFRNIGNKLFSPVKAFDPRSCINRFNSPSQMFTNEAFFWFGAIIRKRLILLVWKLSICFFFPRTGVLELCDVLLPAISCKINAEWCIVCRNDMYTYFEGVNGVKRPATKGYKILLNTDKTRKKLPTSDKKLTVIYRKPEQRSKILTGQPTK